MDIEDFHGLRGARLEPWSPPRSTPGWVGGLYRTIVYVCIYLGTAAHPVLTLQDIDALMVHNIKLVVLFGPCGVGKGTRVRVLADALREKAREMEEGRFVVMAQDVHATREISFSFFKVGGVGYVILGRTQYGMNGDAKWDCWDAIRGGRSDFKIQSIKQAAALLRAKSSNEVEGVILGEGNFGMSIRTIGPKLVFESCGADIDEIDYIHIGYSSAEQYAERINGRQRGSSHQDFLTANTARESRSYQNGNRRHAQCFKDVEELARSWDGEQMGHIRVRQITWDSPRDSIVEAVFGVGHGAHRDAEMHTEADAHTAAALEKEVIIDPSTADGGVCDIFTALEKEGSINNFTDDVGADDMPSDREIVDAAMANLSSHVPREGTASWARKVVRYKRRFIEGSLEVPGHQRSRTFIVETNRAIKAVVENFLDDVIEIKKYGRNFIVKIASGKSIQTTRHMIRSST